ncbi:dehydroquinate synthase/iron-containing alcohol dehydrogenase family protein [Caldicellulosiruptor naganoensis]|uniref:Uncharacterized protein n=1 Tax=Caldicellulosiruptor naganoensis TaxID=29324 RepID=A0ABY7BIB6_9FIRM|nr:hypothetical protein [Caldicellulosiruptor naganoensis]WAM31089.1 hypothetical protein OTJ99_001903 [Caldicellulosiruptor naganoensis]
MKIFWENPYEELLEYLEKNSYKSPLIICDKNTYNVCGNKIHKLIKNTGIECRVVCFDSENLVADEYAIGRVLFETSNNDILRWSGKWNNLRYNTIYSL